MKIVVLGPSPVPFTVGGVENSLWGLCETINQKTAHQAEIIKLPSRENGFWDLIDTYYQFYKLNLSHFDAVICTKYPAWMVEHKNCIYYTQHRLRGLYDTYHFTHLPTKVEMGTPAIDRVLQYMEANPHPINLDLLFQMLFEMKNIESSVPQSYFAFPGPFIRMILHYMDDYAVVKNNPRQFFAISQTVKNRKEYFPHNANITVVHLPSFLKEFTYGDYRHIFMVSRLDGPKRIDMLIAAMQYVKGDIKLYIAGTGPQEAELKKMAAQDSRIVFVGFVNDAEVEKYYANSLVIPYFPYDEDYGLITIEAMMHKKPVITTVDAGGPTEFVINDKTGYVTKFDARAIGEKIDYFVTNPEEARRMGENAYNCVKDITWENTVNTILKSIEKQGDSAVTQKTRKKITVTSTFPIYPPQGGGQARIFYLYRQVAATLFDVEIVSFTNSDQPAFCGMIAPGLKEIRIPKSAVHQEKEREIEKNIGIPITDIGMISLSHNTPEYETALQKSITSSDLVVVSHPYLYPAAAKYLDGKKFIYEAHNVEAKIKKDMLPQNKFAEALLYSR